MTTCLLPLFYEVAHSEAMILHSMKVVKDAIVHLNMDQVPIIAMDQPLFAIAKQIQWSMPSTYGEDKFIIMFGGLHIEMASLKIIGDLLSWSGWATSFIQAGITSPGRADKAGNVTRTRYAIRSQLPACTCY